MLLLPDYASQSVPQPADIVPRTATLMPCSWWKLTGRSFTPCSNQRHTGWLLNRCPSQRMRQRPHKLQVDSLMFNLLWPRILVRMSLPPHPGVVLSSFCPYGVVLPCCSVKDIALSSCLTVFVASTGFAIGGALTSGPRPPEDQGRHVRSRTLKGVGGWGVLSCRCWIWYWIALPNYASGLHVRTRLPRVHRSLQTWLLWNAMSTCHTNSHWTSYVTHLFSVTHTAYTLPRCKVILSTYYA